MRGAGRAVWGGPWLLTGLNVGDAIRASRLNPRVLWPAQSINRTINQGNKNEMLAT